jgi:hypothetical protein
MLAPMNARLKTRLNKSFAAARDAELGTRLGAIETELVPGPGTNRYVDTVNGSDASTNDGLSWEKAYATMGKAFEDIESRDTIYFVGKIREQIVAPLGVYGVTIIAADTTPRHDLAASWMAPAADGVVGKALVEVMEQGWAFINILFQSFTSGAAVKLSRRETAEIPDASHAQFINCRFVGVTGIDDNGGAFNVVVRDCTFQALTGTAILGSNTSGDIPRQWLIEDNRFISCANGIDEAFALSTIRNNVFMGTFTKFIDLTGGTAPNFVYDNIVNVAGADFDPAGGWTGIDGDLWRNYLLDGIEVGLPAN